MGITGSNPITYHTPSTRYLFNYLCRGDILQVLSFLRKNGELCLLNRSIEGSTITIMYPNTTISIYYRTSHVPTLVEEPTSTSILEYIGWNKKIYRDLKKVLGNVSMVGGDIHIVSDNSSYITIR